MNALPRTLAPWRRYVTFALVALLGGVVGGTTIRVDSTHASTTVTIPPAAAASLVAATTGEELIHNRAVGDDAKLINAAMPFSTSPITASSPSSARCHE